MNNFYDKVAKKLGGYGFANDGVVYRSEYPNSDPEEEFYNAVIDSSSPHRKALDIGCGDGIFSFRVADSFARIDGIDNSKILIKIAGQKQQEFNIQNVHFIFCDASAMPYQDNEFDVAFNRRGPSFYDEYARVLKQGGMYIEIGIGEQDARPLKEAFGRGQDFGSWKTRRIDSNKQAFKKAGLTVVRSEDYFYTEYYPSRSMFETFLQSVPIFEDFDTTKDATLLETYYKTHTTKANEILLNRHRVLYVLTKKFS